MHRQVINKSTHRFNEMLNLLNVRFASRSVVYVGMAFHENLGDNLLVEGSLRQFRYLNISVSAYCGDVKSRKFVDKCGDDTFARICPRQSFFVYYHLGGNWGNLWSSVQGYREHIQTLTGHLGIATISGPQTVFFFITHQMIASMTG